MKTFEEKDRILHDYSVSLRTILPILKESVKVNNDMIMHTAYASFLQVSSPVLQMYLDSIGEGIFPITTISSPLAIAALELAAEEIRIKRKVPNEIIENIKRNTHIMTEEFALSADNLFQE